MKKKLKINSLALWLNNFPWKKKKIINIVEAN